MRWRLLTHDRVSAADGLATDEALARRAGSADSTPTLRLYTYAPHAALVGRFQDLAYEVNLPYCAANGIEVNRRPTGGGAIIMGPDQLGVALVLRGRRGGLDGALASPHTPPVSSPPGARSGRARELMTRFSTGLLAGLSQLGITARFRGKNDLEVDGRKIAGLGVFRDPSGGLLFHASLLVDLDVALMTRVLRTPFDGTTDAELGAVEKRTCTVRELLGRERTGQGPTMDDVRAAVAGGFAAAFGASLVPDELDSDEIAAIQALASTKYGTEDWLRQRTEVPDATGAATARTPQGELDVRIALTGRMIKALYLRGTFFADEAAVADLEGRLRWHTSDRERVAATVHAWARERTHADLDPEHLTVSIAEAIAHAIRNATLPQDDPAPYGCFVTPQATHG